MLKINRKLPKEEILRNKKLIERLYSEGESIKNYPIKITYLLRKDFDISHNQAMFVIPKSILPKAVSRNKIKRKLKEIYRHLKYRLLELNDKNNFIIISILYLDKKTEYPFSKLREIIDKCILEIVEKNKE